VRLPDAENPAGMDGLTAAGPVREIGASFGVEHSLALRTTRASYSAVRAEAIPLVVTST
jgi:hypothetical protein